jgi:hypothetical protein
VRAAGGRDDDERLAAEPGAIRGAGNGFSHHGAHRHADEAVLHAADDDRVVTKPADGAKNRVVETGSFPASAQALLLALDVGEVVWVGRAQADVHQFKAGLEE